MAKSDDEVVDVLDLLLAREPRAGLIIRADIEVAIRNLCYSAIRVFGDNEQGNRNSFVTNVNTLRDIISRMQQEVCKEEDVNGIFDDLVEARPSEARMRYEAAREVYIKAGGDLDDKSSESDVIRWLLSAHVDYMDAVVQVMGNQNPGR